VQFSNVGFGFAVPFNSTKLMGAGSEAYSLQAFLFSDLGNNTLRATKTLDQGNGPSRSAAITPPGVATGGSSLLQAGYVGGPSLTLTSRMPGVNWA